MDRPEPDTPLAAKLALLLKAGAASTVVATASVSAAAATAPPAPAATLQDRIDQVRHSLPQLPPGATTDPANEQVYWGNWHNGGWHNGGWHNWHNWGNHF